MLEEVASVKVHEERLAKLLEKAGSVKQETTIDPPLQLSDFKRDILDLNEDFLETAQLNGDALDDTRSAPTTTSSLQTSLETAARNLLYPLIASLDITSPSFITVWNLLDIVRFCNDLCQCEPGVQLRLIEELLDSQTIEGCRHICDYLERRRDAVFRLPSRPYRDEADKERTTKSMQIILLRSCNNLLRRLSRAEDAVLCGRVFIFLFQIYPLGDKSAVNLRGAFHEDNVTVFDDLSTPKHVNDEDDMLVDGEAQDEIHEDTEMAGATAENLETLPRAPRIESMPSEDPNKTIQDSKEEEQEQESDGLTETDKLYTTFWSLQNVFSDPPKLFDKEELDAFKHGLAVTLEKFRTTPKVLQTHATPRNLPPAHQGTKRKRSTSKDAYASNFNPKYLTSRDLFELELSDLTFQRHVLVQALIIIEFLLSLTPRAKRKTAETARKVQSALQYTLTLSDEDAKWAQDTRESIAKYLQSAGPDGKYYYRMADTVLSRDKNWVNWKTEECPPISKPPIPTSDQLAAIGGAKRVCQPRRIKANPMGAVDLSFVSDTKNVNNLETLQGADKCKVEGTKTWVKEVERIDLDLEMPGDDEAYLKEGRTTAVWRALRVASRRRFNILDKVDEGSGLGILTENGNVIEEQVKAEADEAAAETAVNGEYLGEGLEVKVELPAEGMSGNQIMSETDASKASPEQQEGGDDEKHDEASFEVDDSYSPEGTKTNGMENEAVAANLDGDMDLSMEPVAKAIGSSIDTKELVAKETVDEASNTTNAIASQEGDADMQQ